MTPLPPFPRWAVLLLAPCLSAPAEEKKAEDKPLTPAERYNALLKTPVNTSGQGITTDEERMQLIGRVYRFRNELALKFLELAREYPEDPIAVDALIQALWQVNTTPWPVTLVGKDEAQPRALELLQRDHIRSEKLGAACQRVSYGFAKEYETFLRAVLEKSPHEPVQAQACLALAHFLAYRLQRLYLIEEEPRLAKEFEELYGKEYLEELRRQDPARTTREAEALFERAAEKYGDVKIPEDDTVGEKARAELYEIRHLLVGREAPDIEGEDQDGKKFKLSDYRGKVVLIDFWHEQ